MNAPTPGQLRTTDPAFALAVLLAIARRSAASTLALATTALGKPETKVPSAFFT
jgi:hypothetical protein